MPFHYPRQIRFHETDGAGVVYFANVLTLCHEAYEASLAASGIELARFFSPQGIVVPIVHGNVDFFRPMGCGDRITIILTPSPVAKAHRLLSEFKIDYRLLGGTIPAALPETEALPNANDSAAVIAQAQTRHCCLSAEARRRHPLPDDLQTWLGQWTAPDLP